MRNLSVIWSGLVSYAAAGLAAGLLVTSVGWYVTSLKLENERAGRELDLKGYEKAQSEYEAKALREKQEIERKNNERAEKADASYQSLLEQYNASLVRYQAAQRSLSRNYLPRTSEAPESSDGPDTNTELPSRITILFEDAEICAVNTARLQAVQEWATSQK